MIGQVLNNIVMNDATIKGIVQYSKGGSTKYAFTPNVVPQGVPTPAACYKVVNIDSVDTKDDFSGIEKYQVQIDLFSGDYDELNDLDGAFRNAMNKAEGLYTVTDFDGSSIQIDVGVSRHDETSDVFFDDADTHGRSTEYSIIINKTP